MIPAAIPARSWSLPSDGETLWVVSSFSCTGNAPYCSTVARSFASLSLKFPEIWMSPEKLGSLNCGADCTTPSSTMATAFCGGVFG